MTDIALKMKYPNATTLHLKNVTEVQNFTENIRLWNTTTQNDSNVHELQNYKIYKHLKLISYKKSSNGNDAFTPIIDYRHILLTIK